MTSIRQILLYLRNIEGQRYYLDTISVQQKTYPGGQKPSFRCQEQYTSLPVCERSAYYYKLIVTVERLLICNQIGMNLKAGKERGNVVKFIQKLVRTSGAQAGKT
jgi:hypothetical protein